MTYQTETVSPHDRREPRLPAGSLFLARCLGVGCVIGLVGGPLLLSLSILVIQANLTVEGVTHSMDAPWMTTARRLTVFAAMMLVAAMPLYALHRFRLFLKACLKSRPFSHRAMAHFRAAALMILLQALFMPILRMIVQLIVDGIDPSQQPDITLRVSSGDITGVFIGMAVLFIAHILSVARELDEEVGGFV